MSHTTEKAYRKTLSQVSPSPAGSTKRPLQLNVTRPQERTVSLAPALLGLCFFALLFGWSYFNGKVLLEEIIKSGFIVSGLLVLYTLQAGRR
ncbi:MAG: hypothetical protein EP344_03915 [Bacteroidetes bacterium]|nr:MAG: hypothetical protein EP344_03915 [Bacteroidota bacterium]